MFVVAFLKYNQLSLLLYRSRLLKILLIDHSTCIPSPLLNACVLVIEQPVELFNKIQYIDELNDFALLIYVLVDRDIDILFDWLPCTYASVSVVFWTELISIP